MVAAEVFLKDPSKSNEQIGAELGLTASTVQTYLKRARKEGLNIPTRPRKTGEPAWMETVRLLQEKPRLTDKELAARLEKGVSGVKADVARAKQAGVSLPDRRRGAR